MKTKTPTPFKYKGNPLKSLRSPFRASSAFDTEMENFRGLNTDALEVGNAAQVGQQTAKNQKFENQFAEAKNAQAGINTENFAEELGVNKQASEFAKQQNQQQSANIMQGMSGAAGGSGIAGLAQMMSNQGAKQAQASSASIGQQESRNQGLKVRGAQDVQRRRELEKSGQGAADLQRMTGAQSMQAAKAQSGMQQAQMNQAGDIANMQSRNQNNQLQYQAASDARNMQFQKSQGMLSLISGQDAADAANAEADKNWGQKTFGW